VFVNTVVPPAVPPRQSCLRTSYMATHTDEQLEYILGAFRQAQAQVRTVG
jgi:8-amino-7-oxononanoate synthase